MNHLVRIPKRSPSVRQSVSGSFAGPKMDDFSPYDSRVDSGFTIVQGADAAEYRLAGESIRRKGYEVNAIVNACVRITADQIGVALLESYSVQKDGTVILHPTDELQQLLDQPGPQLPGFTFRRTLATHLVMYGNGYAKLDRMPNGRIDRIRIIHPERLINVVVDEMSNEIIAYQWQDGRGRQTLTPWTDILHVKDLIVEPDGYFGFPRGLSALAQMVTDNDASGYVRQVLNNSGVPAMVLFARQGTGIDELRRAEEVWHDRMVEQGHRGRTRFVGGVESLQVIGHSLKDLEFPSLRQISREDICAAFGVDPRLVGASSAKGNEGGLSGSQYQEARRRLEQQTCHPLRIAIQDALDTTVTPEYGNRYARFAPDAIAAIVETPTEVAQRTAVLVASNIATLDEARRINGLPEVQNPSHVTAAPALQTIEDALAANELAAAAGGVAQTTGDVAKGATVSEQVNGPDGITDANNNTERQNSASKPTVRSQEPPSRVRLSGAPELTEEEEKAAWRAFDARAQAIEPMLEGLAVEAIDEAMATVLRTLDRALDGASVRAQNDPWWDRFLAGLTGVFSSTGAIRSMWKRMFLRRVEQLMTRAAEDLAEQISVKLDSDAPRFQAGVRARIDTLVRSVTQTMYERLAEIVAVSRAANLSPSELATIIRNTQWADMARRVARTESVGLINHAEMLAVQQSNVIRKKRWLSQRDDRVRSTHKACDSQGWIDIEAAFPNGLQYAHDPNGSSDEVANCRCGTMYSDRENQA